MIRENWRLLNFLNGLSDVALNIGAIFLAYLTRFVLMSGASSENAALNHLLAGAFYALTMCFLYAVQHLYEPARTRAYQEDISAVIRANLIGILVLGGTWYLIRFVDFSRLAMLFSFVYSTVLVAAKHVALRTAFRHYRSRGYNRRFSLVVGTGPLAQQYVDALRNVSYLGIEGMGYIRCRAGENLQGLPLKGGMDELPLVLERDRPDQVVIALGEEDIRYLRPAIDACNQSGTRFSIIPFFAPYVFSSAAPTVETLGGGVQLFDFGASPLDYVANKFVKRAMDVAACLLMLAALSPLMLLAAIGVKLSGAGPVFYRQQRVGLGKKHFSMYKFRSMRVNADDISAWSSKGDPRITPFGRFMRKTNIDELPQLWNVLKGDMSLIGPRPEIPYHVGHFKSEIPYYMARHQIRPGITGWAQVNGLRGDTSIEERVKYDLFYIYNWSLLFDVRVLFKTLFSRGE